MKCKISAVFAALFLAVILTSCGSKGKNIVPVELWYGATFSEAGNRRQIGKFLTLSAEN